MSRAEAQTLHSYHQPPHHSAPMSGWPPAPAPYHEGAEHRPPASEPQIPPHQHQHHSQHHPPYPPQQSYHPPPPPPPSSNPSYGPDPSYSRPSSVSAPAPSPPNPPPQHYAPPPVNGTPHESYYPPPPPPPAPSQDYRNRPPYGPSESPVNGPPQPPHLVTNHEMMSAQPPQGPPPAGYAPPPPHSAGPTPQYWGPPPDWYNQQRRKPVRAAQACDSCRQRKAKCDEGRPDCTHCKENGLKCTYRDVPPQKSEKQIMAVHERLDSVSETMSQLATTSTKQEESINRQEESIKRQEASIDRIVKIQENMASQMHHLMESISSAGTGSSSVAMVKTRSRPPTKEEPRSEVEFPGHQNINAPFMQSFDSSAGTVPFATESSDKGRKTRGPMGASDLLLWPSIKDLVPKDQSVSYVMDGEEERGLLRLYGCGEGEDKADGHDGAPSPAGSSTSSRIDEDHSHSSPTGVWGTGQLPQREGKDNPAHDHPGGVTPEGQLLLDTRSVDTYVKSYLDRMHILHPFLDPRVLRKMVYAFKRKHSWDFERRAYLHQSIGSKRKRESSESPSSVMMDDSSLRQGQLPSSTQTKLGKQPIEHSVSNAIILLVIALGKICAHAHPLPAPVKSSTITSSTKLTPAFQGYMDLPPAAASAPSSPYSPAGNTNGHVVNPVVSNMLKMQGKNMDVIPGLAYFAKASDILGELAGGTDVSHVQANLLAGLYMGQLARIIPSHWFIANACRACQILISSAAYKENRMSAERRNLINFAFWSCLQLESDILAEMDVPSSGIIAKEASMLREIPTALTIADPDKEDAAGANPQEFLRHYSNQIQLRRTLNDAMHNIYTERDQNKPNRIIETIAENLEMWRELLKDWAWTDEEHESKDINHARMRGKYYGAKYIIHRPALHYALSQSHPSTPMSRPSESPLAGQSEHTSPAVTHFNGTPTGRRVNEMRPPARGGEQLEEWVLRACRLCVEAAIKSTTVFDGVERGTGRRLIITNIFGTAHAQFGNVLVLSATYNSSNPQLRSLVPEATLKYLLNRTIAFLWDKKDISPALSEDAKILTHVRHKLFGGPLHPALQLSATSSFSSNR